SRMFEDGEGRREVRHSTYVGRPGMLIREVKCFPERGLNRPSVCEPRKRERLSDGDFARSGGII
ncbi:hypothetical protein, partial [Thermincola ferriacetica]|uniref:hypothetical protein n=1 Tax=Thermincola ferriacetica TaxID=281456 RepID=UPI001FA6E4A4